MCWRVPVVNVLSEDLTVHIPGLLSFSQFRGSDHSNTDNAVSLELPQAIKAYRYKILKHIHLTTTNLLHFTVTFKRNSLSVVILDTSDMCRYSPWSFVLLYSEETTLHYQQ